MDDVNLYFVFEHCMYGTLSNLITIKGIILFFTYLGRLSEELSRIYTAMIVKGLKCMHDQ